jgi:hypothetical protein
MTSRDEIVAQIKQLAERLGHPPTRVELKRESGISGNQILNFFENYREAVDAAGLKPDTSRMRIDETQLLSAWGKLVRSLRKIPTVNQNRKHGEFSAQSYERRFGPWSTLPDAFRTYAEGKAEWQDVLALLPVRKPIITETKKLKHLHRQDTTTHQKLSGRPTYGDPLDFRGLRHEPVNELGTVFLFGMVARELGYLVEGVQGSFPDCDAKRQIGPGEWQGVRIEFEFESRNFYEHGHSPDECDVIVCWRHNWPECPPNIEILELSKIITSLATSED